MHAHVLSLAEKQLGHFDGEQGEIAEDGDAFRIAVREEHLVLDGPYDGVEAVDAEYEREEDAKGIETVHDVVGEVARDPRVIVQRRRLVGQHDVVVGEYDHAEDEIGHG